MHFLSRMLQVIITSTNRYKRSCIVLISLLYKSLSLAKIGPLGSVTSEPYKHFEHFHLQQMEMFGFWHFMS